jgi:hypothetical protein
MRMFIPYFVRTSAKKPKTPISIWPG